MNKKTRPKDRLILIFHLSILPASPSSHEGKAKFRFLAIHWRWLEGLRVGRWVRDFYKRKGEELWRRGLGSSAGVSPKLGRRWCEASYSRKREGFQRGMASSTKFTTASRTGRSSHVTALPTEVPCLFWTFPREPLTLWSMVNGTL